MHNSMSVTPVMADNTGEVVIKVANANVTRVQNIMGGVILNGNVRCEMELDTAACNSIMSYDHFKEIVSKSGDKPPLLERGAVIMKMADGTLSNSVKGRTCLSIARADMPNRTGVFEVIIVDGPHALLGRPTLQALWPEQYNNFASIAKKSVDALCSSNACSACINLVYTCGTEGRCCWRCRKPRHRH